jgi:hypothetical protein
MIEMDEDRAWTIAQSIGGETWQVTCEDWVALKRRKDGRLVAISDECICEYAAEKAFDAGTADVTIRLD